MRKSEVGNSSRGAMFGETDAATRVATRGATRVGTRVAFQTLGCRLNQYETDSLATDFKRGGYSIVPFDSPADCYIVNTCTVTDRSDRKSRNLIHRARRSWNAGDDTRGTDSPVVVVTGCFAEANEEYAANLDGVTYVVGNERKHTIFDVVDAHFRNEIVSPLDLESNRFGFGDALEGFHTRATIKVQDGCDNFCTFCVIPFVRGRAESRPAGEILEHASRVIDLGAKEIILTGVNMGRYDSDSFGFPELVRSILELPGEFRLRLSSIEPDIHGDGFEDLVLHEKFCPHLHLCLQSGADRVLIAMRRQYTVASYREMVEALRLRDPSMNFTTDIIVGFPGETDSEFEETIALVEEIGFSHVHTFPYSVRTGTRAERMSGHIDETLKSERAARIRETAGRLKRRNRELFVGKSQRLLVERTDKSISPRGNPTATGHGEHYHPIEIDSPGVEHNTFVDVEITGVADREEPVLIGSMS